MPDVPPPEELQSRIDWWRDNIELVPETHRKAVLRQRAIDFRPVDPMELPPRKRDPRGASWFKTVAPLDGDRRMHQAVLGYASDSTLLGTSTFPHGVHYISHNNLQMASLDHALWLHEDFRADEWLLYAPIRRGQAMRAASTAGKFSAATGGWWRAWRRRTDSPAQQLIRRKTAPAANLLTISLNCAKLSICGRFTLCMLCCNIKYTKERIYEQFPRPFQGPAPQRDRYGAERNSASSLAIVVAMHGAALLALALAKPQFIERVIDPPIQTIDIEEIEAPPPERAEQERCPSRKRRRRSSGRKVRLISTERFPCPFRRCRPAPQPPEAVRTIHPRHRRLRHPRLYRRRHPIR